MSLQPLQIAETEPGLGFIEQLQALRIAMDPPEWMIQWTKIQNGEATWEDYTFEEKTCKGWLWPYLLQIDSLPRLMEQPAPDEMIFENKAPVLARGGSGRWRWWMEAHSIGRLPDGDIPKINFLGLPDHETINMLQKCLDADWNYRLPDFLDWLLWGFGEGDERPRVSEKVNEKWYRLFNLGLMIVNPTDYWGTLYSETKGRGIWNKSGFFATPQHVCKMMAQMSMHDALKQCERDDIDSRLLSVNEPCMGTGRMLMEASNYSVNLYGQDIDYVCVAATKINAYLYIPWLARPALWVQKLREEQMEALDKSPDKVVTRIIQEVNPEYRVEFENTSKTGVHRFKIKNGPARKTKFKVRELNSDEFRTAYEKAVDKGMRAKMKRERKAAC